MARDTINKSVDLRESSVYGNAANENDASPGDTADDATLDRLENITGGAEEPGIYEGALDRDINALDATTAEEIEALKVDLLQDNARPDSRDGSGRIVDRVAEEQLAGFTEVGPDLGDRGAASVAPGRDNTSSVLQRHYSNTPLTHSKNDCEGNLDEPRDEERAVGKGSPA